jgi:hypothetical protein
VTTIRVKSGTVTVEVDVAEARDVITFEPQAPFYVVRTVGEFAGREVTVDGPELRSAVSKVRFRPLIGGAVVFLGVWWLLRKK